MTAAEVEAMLAEMEPDIRAADRDLREIELLEKKDITAAGKLSDYEVLQPRLDALMKAHGEDLHKAAELEKRIAALMNRYATNVRSRFPLSSQYSDTSHRWILSQSCSSPGTTPFGMQSSRSRRWRRNIRSRDGLASYDTCFMYFIIAIAYTTITSAAVSRLRLLTVDSILLLTQ